MKRNHFFFACLFCLFTASAFAQTYTPSAHVQVNDAVAPAQATPLEARSMFFDGSNFIYRAYQSTSEVLSYLNTTASRTGNFIIIVDSGGTLQGNGTYLNPHNTYYMFADSTTSGQLKKMNLFGNGIGTCSDCLLALNNLSDLGSLSTALVNLNLNNVDNTSDASKNAATVALTNHTINGSLNTLTNIPNSALVNTSIGLTLNNLGTNPTVTTTPAALGTSLVLAVPYSNGTNSGFLHGSDWALFDNKIDSVHVSNDSIYNCVNGTCTLQSVLTGTGAVNSVTGTNTSLLFSPSMGNVMGQVNQNFAFNFSNQITFTGFAPIFSTLVTPGGLFYGNSAGQFLQSGGGSNGQIFQSTGGGTAPIFFLPDAATVEGWLGYTPLTAALPSTQIFVGNGSNVATGVNVTQDASTSNTGAWTNTGLKAKALPSLPGTTQNLAYNGSTWIFQNNGLSQVYPGVGTYVAGTDTVGVDSVWHRKGPNAGMLPVLTADQNNAAEITVLKVPHSQLGLGPDSVYAAWVDMGWSWTHVSYFESLSPTGPWTRYSGDSVISGHNRTSVHWKGDSLIAMCVPVSPQTTLDRFASIDGIHWTLTNAAIISTTSWYNIAIANSWVYYDADSTAYYLMMDGAGTATNGALLEGVWKSTDDVNYTDFAGAPVTTVNGPWFTKVGGVYWLWGQPAEQADTIYNFLPTELWTQYSTDLKHWTFTTNTSVFERVTDDEGADSAVGQIGDPDILFEGNRCYLYYDGTRNGGQEGAPPTYGLVQKTAEAYMHFDTLITTKQNAEPFMRWQSQTATGGLSPRNMFWQGHIGVGTTATQQAYITLGPTKFNTAPFRFTPYQGTPPFGMPDGSFLAYGDSVGLTDHIGHTNTLAFVNQVTGDSLEQSIIYGNHLGLSHTIVQANATFLYIHDPTGSAALMADSIVINKNNTFGLNLQNAGIQAFSNTTIPNIQFGAMTIQEIGGGNFSIGSNVGEYGGSFKAINTGASARFAAIAGNLYYQVAPSTSAGSSPSFGTPLAIANNQNVLFGSGGADASNGVYQFTNPNGTGNMMSFMNGAGTSTMYENTNGQINWNGPIGMGIGLGTNVPTARLHLAAGTATASQSPLKFTSGTNLSTPEDGAVEYDGTHYYATVSTTRYQLDRQGVSNYAHTIFAPTTGGTVNLVNNQYNIINPAGALLALTVNLPSSPANNDVVYIKYTQTITTVTYANGTVVDGITGPAAGGLVVLTYDSGTTSWY